MDFWHLAAIALAGVFAGTVNTIAGGGSLIGIPVLIFAGLPAPVANATNRVGVIFQSAAASVQFSRAGLIDRSSALRAVIPSCLGAITGALLSVDIDEALFERVIGVAMLIMLVVIVIGPKRWLEGRSAASGTAAGATSNATSGATAGATSGATSNGTAGAAAGAPWAGWRYLGFFCVGVYGGFLQAGVGIFLLAALVLFAGQDLLRANATKALLIALFTTPALAIYLYHGLVAWAPGLSLAAGSTVGAWLGARLTVSWGPRFVRWVLVIVISVAATRLLGAW